MSEADMIVIGGGVAGLSAAVELSRARLHVLLLEASSRLGGRVHTVRADSGIPIDLGAEFIHGKPEMVMRLVGAHQLELEQMAGDSLRSVDGRLVDGDDFFPRIMKLLGAIRVIGADRSFAEFLAAEGQEFDEETRRSAWEYVSGFHAADPNRISEHALAKSTKAGEQEGSEQSFRLVRGYSAIPDVLEKQLTTDAQVRLNTDVREIRWGKGHVEAIADDGARFRARAALITVPLPVWSRLRLEPELPQKRSALEKLAMGAVLRISMQFSSPWWREVQQGRARDMSFLFSHHPDVPTWWCGTGAQPNVLTGWCAADRAQRLSALSLTAICHRAIGALADVCGVSRSEVERRQLTGFWTHNWQGDPHVGGGYSYVLKGGEAAPRALARPVEHTIFVAGEATDFAGDNGTVHGAMATGLRAAREILEAFRMS